jgi:hypothetical protein
MLQRTSTRLAAALLLGGAAVVIGTAAPDAHATTTHPSISLGACIAKVTGDSVAIAPTPVTVEAALTEAIGDSISATLPRESNVSVVKVAPASSATANAVQLTLNTSKATPGAYKISMKGTAGECTGDLTVTGGK